MVASGVVSVYDAGTEAVWGIGEDQHLVAAFTAAYRSISWSIGRRRLALLAATGPRQTAPVSPATVRDGALSLRDC